MKLYNTPGLSQIYFRRSLSPPYLKKSSYESTGFFFVYFTHRGDEKPRPGFDNWRQPVGQTVNAVSGLPAGRAKRVNPPLTAIFKEELVRRYGLFFVYCTHRGDEKPRPGFDNWRQPVGQTVNAVSGLPAGRAKRVNPPLTAIFKEELVRRYGLFFVYCTHRGDEKPRPGCLVNAPVHSLSPRLMGEFCHESPRPEEFPPI